MGYDVEREPASYEECPEDGWEEWYADNVADHLPLPESFGLCPEGLHKIGACDCGTCGGESDCPF